ncbi:MAG: Mpo1-like protein [Planctomycetota bacterium]
MKRYATFTAFWPAYLQEHRCPRCRFVHYVAATAVLGILTATLCMSCWWLMLLAPVFAYGIAWFGHLVFEKNRPATWTHPWWSLRAEWRMFWLAATGRLAPHLAAQKTPAVGEAPASTRENAEHDGA